MKCFKTCSLGLVLKCFFLSSVIFADNLADGVTGRQPKCQRPIRVIFKSTKRSIPEVGPNGQLEWPHGQRSVFEPETKHWNTSAIIERLTFCWQLFATISTIVMGCESSHCSYVFAWLLSIVLSIWNSTNLVQARHQTQGWLQFSQIWCGFKLGLQQPNIRVVFAPAKKGSESAIIPVHGPNSMGLLNL